MLSTITESTELRPLTADEIDFVAGGSLASECACTAELRCGAELPSLAFSAQFPYPLVPRATARLVRPRSQVGGPGQHHRGLQLRGYRQRHGFHLRSGLFHLTDRGP